jgi:hypothetical protein
MAFLGALGTATDQAFVSLGGATVARYDPPLQDRMLRATTGSGAPIVDRVPAQFDAPPPQRANRANGADVVYSFADSIGLSRNRKGRLDVVLWDPPPIVDYWYRPIRDNLNGDPTPYVLAAATLTDQLGRRDAPRVARTDLAETMTLSAWTVRGGGMRVLAGTLEEGLSDTADGTRRLRLQLPKSWRGHRWTDWEGGAAQEVAGTLPLELEAQGSVLLRASRAK